MEKSKFYQIKNITEHEYTLVGCDGSVITRPIQEIDKIASSFTIDDAKDGDVLYSLDTYQPFIYKARNIHEQATAYCGINKHGKFFVWNTNDCIITLDKYIPATKEQCDTLMKAMADGGYTFDFEKKVLKKIEDEEYNGEDYGIDSLYHAQRILEKTLGSVDGYQTDDGILSHKCAITAVKKLYEQKPAWSEEDEEYINDLIGVFDGQQHQAHSDEEVVNWLKSIRLQYNKEWGKSDEEMLKSIIATCELACEDRDSSPARHLLEMQTNWLKSLKQIIGWKPSEEQIECLYDAINHYQTNGYPASKLNELYEQMSKIYKL